MYLNNKTFIYHGKLFKYDVSIISINILALIWHFKLVVLKLVKNWALKDIEEKP